MVFLDDLAIKIKTWANGKFQKKLPSPVGRAGQVLTSDGTVEVWTASPPPDLTGLINEIDNKLLGKVDVVAGKGLSDNNYSNDEKTKLGGLSNYSHPASHSPSIILQDANNRFVTDTEKTNWNNKASTTPVTTSTNGLMIAADKVRFNAISNYLNTNALPPGYIAQTSSYRFVTDTEKTTWSNKSVLPLTHLHNSANGNQISYTDLSNLPVIPNTILYPQVTLNIDGSLGNFIIATISTNSSFSLSNITMGIHYYIMIYNNGANAITITLPTTADVKPSTTFTVSASKRKEVAMIYDGERRYWQISEELI